MNTFKHIHILIVLIALVVSGCSDIAGLDSNQESEALSSTSGIDQQIKLKSSAQANQQEEAILSQLSARPEFAGALTANGWYEGEEIYYIDHGREEGVTERGENDIYLIGDNRKYQANVVEFIPGEAGYSPHWNVYLVHSAEGVTVQDILDSGYASPLFESEGVLFDDVEDLRAALQAGLVTFIRPGVVVLCPIISEEGAEAPGNREASEEFEPFGETF